MNLLKINPLAIAISTLALGLTGCGGSNNTTALPTPTPSGVATTNMPAPASTNPSVTKADTNTNTNTATTSTTKTPTKVDVNTQPTTTKPTDTNPNTVTPPKTPININPSTTNTQPSTTKPTTTGTTTTPTPKTTTEPNKPTTTKPTNTSTTKETKDWRDFGFVPSDKGGSKFNPIISKKDGVAVAKYMSGPLTYENAKNEHKNLSLANLAHAEKTLASLDKIDPKTVQYVNLLNEQGETIGKFQLVNQAHSSYGTFMAKFNATLDPTEPAQKESLAFYTAKPTTTEQFNAQSGTANYHGKVLGYHGGINKNGSTEASANINLQVDFGKREISGLVKGSERFDSITEYNYRYTDDDDKPTEKSKRLGKLDLVLEPTKIVDLGNGYVGFGGVTGAMSGNAWDTENESNVVIKDNGTTYKSGFGTYGGIFAGPNAEEVVGQLTSGEDRLIFGATKE